MKRFGGKIGLRLVGGALLAFAVILLAAATPSAASTYTLNFSGTVTGATGVFSALGVVNGDNVSGAITYNPFNDNNGVAASGVNLFTQSSAVATFHVDHPGGLDFTYTATGDGHVASAAGSIFLGSGAGFVFSAGDSNTDLQLQFRTDVPMAGPLSSLTGLPTNPYALVALLPGAVIDSLGSFLIRNFGSLDFNVALSPVAQTPIPAALPLFGVGLAALGFASRKRRAGGRATE